MKYALVTGSTKGIGLAIARRLLAQGCHVIMNYAHSEAAANALKATLAGVHPGRCHIVAADLSTHAGVDTLAQAVCSICPHLDYLVLNCGATDRTPFGDITPDAWNRVLDQNVSMPFFLLQALYPHMAPGGAVAAVSSLMATHPHAVSISYGVSKAALSALCQNMVKYLSGKSIRINAIEPGFIQTDWQSEKPPEVAERIAGKIALHRFGSPDEVADLVYHTLTNTYMNGAVIPLSGGYDMA